MPENKWIYSNGSNNKRCVKNSIMSKISVGNSATDTISLPQVPGDFVTKVKQINSQLDLIWMRSLPARLTSLSDPLSTPF